MLVRIVILGLLSQKSMTGYEIQQTLELGFTEGWAGILPGSIYHALKKLENEKLVEIVQVKQTGNRIRTIYGINTAGRSELNELLLSTFKTADLPFPSDIYMSLVFINNINPQDLLNAIDENIKMTKDKLKQWEDGEAAKSQYIEMPRYVKEVFKNGQDHYKVHLEFLEELRRILPEEMSLFKTMNKEGANESSDV